MFFSVELVWCEVSVKSSGCFKTQFTQTIGIVSRLSYTMIYMNIHKDRKLTSEEQATGPLHRAAHGS